MKTKWFALSALATSLVIPCSLTTPKAYAAAPGSPAMAGYQEGRWDDVPSDFNDARREGFHEGVEAARRDFEGHRHKDADDHEMYKHPRVPHDQRDEFREGFRRGYESAMQHMREERHEDMPH